MQLLVVKLYFQVVHGFIHHHYVWSEMSIKGMFCLEAVLTCTHDLCSEQK